MSTTCPYHFPVSAWFIFTGAPSMVTSGDEVVAAMSLLDGSSTTIWIICGPPNEFSGAAVAETLSIPVCATATGVSPGIAMVIPPANIIVISVILVSFLYNSLFILLLSCSEDSI